MWAIGLRTLGSRADDIEEAVRSRAIVRTWLMRGTLHVAAAEDLRWLLDLLAPKIIARSKRRDENLRLDEAVYGDGRAVFIDALENHGQLTRIEMMDALEKAGISTAGQRGYHILRHLALEKLICFGPMVGKEPSFVLLDDWVPPGKKMPHDRALGELALRYLAGHGPASIQDLVWWSGITASEARMGIEMARSDLEEETRDGTAYFSAPNDLKNDGAGRVHLLPGYDEYIIGYRDRSAVLDKGHTKDVLSSNGVFYPALVIDGRVNGTWRAVQSKKGVSIKARPFSRLNDDELTALDEAVERYGKFIGRSVMVFIG